MAHIDMLPGEELPEESQKILQEIQQGMGKVPNLFRTYAQHPPLLRANWEKVKATMMGGSLPRKLKESIALLVSQDNDCEYCVVDHSGALESVGVDKATIEQIRAGALREAGFDAKEVALIDLMRAANRDPRQVSNTEFQAARDAGANDAEILEAYAVMETFVAFNKFLISAQVPID